MPSITVRKQFNAPVEQVFTLLSAHENYNVAFAPLKVKRTQISGDPQYPDGIGSIRQLGFGFVWPLQEQIRHFEPNRRIEYQIIDSRLVKYHLGVIEFEMLDANTTLVTYTIELKTHIPFAAQLIVAQLKSAIKLGLFKLAKTL